MGYTINIGKILNTLLLTGRIMIQNRQNQSFAPLPPSPYLHAWRIPSAKGEVRTPESHNQHTHSALMAPSPPPSPNPQKATPPPPLFLTIAPPPPKGGGTIRKGHMIRRFRTTWHPTQNWALAFVVEQPADTYSTSQPQGGGRVTGSTCRAQQSNTAPPRSTRTYQRCLWRRRPWL